MLTALSALTGLCAVVRTFARRCFERSRHKHKLTIHLGQGLLTRAGFFCLDSVPQQADHVVAPVFNEFVRNQKCASIRRGQINETAAKLFAIVERQDLAIKPRP